MYESMRPRVRVPRTGLPPIPSIMMAHGIRAMPTLMLYIKLPAENRESADLNRVPLKLDDANDDEDEDDGDDFISCITGDIMADALALKGESIITFPFLFFSFWAFFCDQEATQRQQQRKNGFFTRAIRSFMQSLTI